MSAIGGVPRIPPGPVAARNASARRAMSMMFASSSTAADPSIVLHPLDQVRLIRAGLGAITVDDDANIIDLARLALAFRAATGPGGIRGTPPIADINNPPGGVGSPVLLEPETSPTFWASPRDGTLPPGPVGDIPPIG